MKKSRISLFSYNSNNTRRFNVTSFDVINERLFSIANKIYDSHKSFHLAIIRAKMIIRQFDYKKNEFKLLNNSQFDLKEEKDYFKQDVKKKVEIRNQVLQNEMNVYINDVNENAAIVSFVEICVFFNEKAVVDCIQTSKEKKRVHSTKDSTVKKMKSRTRDESRNKKWKFVLVMKKNQHKSSFLFNE